MPPHANLLLPISGISELPEATVIPTTLPTTTTSKTTTTSTSTTSTSTTTLLGLDFGFAFATEKTTVKASENNAVAWLQNLSLPSTTSITTEKPTPKTTSPWPFGLIPISVGKRSVNIERHSLLRSHSRVQMSVDPSLRQLKCQPQKNRLKMRRKAS